MSAPRASLASLLGSQVDSFQAQLHSDNTNNASGQKGKNTKSAKKSNATIAPAASSIAPAASSALSTPFTHTIAQPALLTSLLQPATTDNEESQPNTIASSIDTAHAILAQLLPKEVSDTPEPVEFHSAFLAYLDACAGGNRLQIDGGETDGSDSGKKNKKRKRATSDSPTIVDDDALRSCALALHTVSTTVVGRLAARCITLLGQADVNEEDSVPFDATLLRSPSSYWSILFMLIRSDSLSARFTPALFPLLTKHSALPLIECALVHLHDASERDLVEVTKYVLDHLPNPEVDEKLLPVNELVGSSDVEQQQTKKKRKKNARSMVAHANKGQEPIKVVQVPGGPFAVILDLLLTSPVSANFLRHSLSTLGPHHASKLLGYLYAWTLRYWFHTESEVHSAIHEITRQANEQTQATAVAAAAAASESNGQPTTTSTRKVRSQFRIPSFSQVIDWMNILLDAIDFMHVYQKEESRSSSSSSGSSSSFSSLALYDLVSSLASHISHHHLQFLDRSQDLKGFISIFAQLKRQPNSMPLPQAPMMDYNVELIELGA